MSTVDVELDIAGMTCASCATRIERKLNRLRGVEASVNYATEKARVRVSDVDTAELIATVEAPGYQAAIPSPPAAAERPGGGDGRRRGQRRCRPRPGNGRHRRGDRCERYHRRLRRPLVVADAIQLARRTLGIIKGNLFWAFAAIPVAMAALLNPLVAAAAVALSWVFVVTNSLRVRRFRPTPALHHVPARTPHPA